MAWLIWLIGLLIAALGVSVVLHPAVLTGMLKTVRKPPILYLIGAIRAILGVIFLVWARSCNQTGVIIVFGILLICSGVFVFLAPKTQINRMIDFFLRRPEWVRRIWGLATFAIGAIIVWAGWPR
jgi:uncharacterized protein YjeT (DUF2065 family)